jgi:hypothetical protein
LDTGTPQLTIKMTIELDERWSGNSDREGLIEYLQARFNSSLGFRGSIKKFKIVKR